MNLIETKPVGETHLSHFAVDFGDADIRLNGKQYPTGKVTHDILCLPPEWVKALFYKGDALYALCCRWTDEGYSTELFSEIKNRLFDILDYIKAIPPFCYFDIDGEYTALNNFFYQDALQHYEEDFRKYGTFFYEQLPYENKLRAHMTAFSWIVSSYIYLTGDTLNFLSVANMFFVNLTENDKRTKSELAEFARTVFGDPEITEKIMQSNHTGAFNNFTLHPTAEVAPVIIETESGSVLGRRMVFNRMLNFYVTDLFEGLAAGHYSWQCGICHRFFFMETAHKQLYCSTVNPEYGVPCAYVAKNKPNMPKQKKKDGFGYAIWKKRYGSLRNEKHKTNKNLPSAKYDIDVCDKAIELAKRHYEEAQIDFDYAQNQYEQDMVLRNLINEAKATLGKK